MIRIEGLCVGEWRAGLVTATPEYLRQTIESAVQALLAALDGRAVYIRSLGDLFR